MDKILEMLGIDKLDESKQNDIKQKLDDHIQLKVDEKVKEKETEIKDNLTEQYEEKFEEYKNDISEKFSDFVDGIIDEEMAIPENIKEYARKGELYEDVIETLKTRIAIDEGLVDEEAKNLLKESKSEIEKMKGNVDKLTNENFELKKDAKEFAANIYLREKCDELSVDQKEKALSLLEGVTDTEEIDRKINIIIESNDNTNDKDNDNDLNEDDNDKDKNNNNDLNENKTPFDFWNHMLSQKK